MPAIATARGIRRTFGRTVALDDVDLDINPGDSLGLLGPNGAGKTTMISLLTGLRRPDAGQVRVFGRPPHEPAARLRLGVTPQATAVPPTLRVAEVVDFVASHFPDPMPTPELLERFGLAESTGKPAGALSGGQQRRLLVALALVGRPELVVLDEPTTGLDVEARHLLWSELGRYRDDGGTLLLTSHYLAEIEALASRVVVFDRGRVIATGSVRDITAKIDLTHVELITDAGDETLRDLPGVVDVHHVDGMVRLAARDSDAVVRGLVQRDISFSQLRIQGASLEDAFLDLTSGRDAPVAPGNRARLNPALSKEAR